MKLIQVDCLECTSTLNTLMYANHISFSRKILGRLHWRKVSGDASWSESLDVCQNGGKTFWGALQFAVLS